MPTPDLASVAADPTKPAVFVPPDVTRLVLVDAMNLAYWCDRPPSLRVPLAVLAALRARGQPVGLIFDASARHRLGEEASLYRHLLEGSAEISEVPSGRPADRELLRQARAKDALLLSRDRFRDHRLRYRRLIDDPARVFGGYVADDRIHIPMLVRDVPLPASVAAICEGLRDPLAMQTVAQPATAGTLT